MQPVYHAIRRRLLLTTLLPLLATLLVCWLLGNHLITARIAGQAQEEVRSDLGTAQELLLSELHRLSEGVQLISRSPELSRSLQQHATDELAHILSLLSGSRSFNFLTVFDRYGQVRFRAANPEQSGDTLRHLKPVAEALAGRTNQGVLVLSPLQAAQENPLLPEQMLVALVPSQHAEPTSRTAEQHGLFLVASAPITTPQGVLCGGLVAGVLLNNNEQLADRITRVIAPLQHNSVAHGNATLFLGDVRIATSVVDEQNRRATGTRMSAAVAKQVLQQGERWMAPAFVLHERYFAGYEPLRDVADTVVGALYVGLPERPYTELRRNLNVTFALLLLALTLFAVVLTTRLGTRLTARELEINTLNRTLEHKVVERTAELEEKNRRLRETEKELARTERLAELGMLSAGVAHEINNPLAIIRGNAELLQMSLQECSGCQEEVTEILQQTGRISRITASLLSLARQEQRQFVPFQVNELLDEILDQIVHQFSLELYEIVRAYQHVGLYVLGDREQLRQVFTNLILNGLQAMESGGTLTVQAELDPAGLCSVKVVDTGAGIAPEQQERLFTPFYTTKQHGTGLGLAISWGIVRNHGGTIDVQSVPGVGACFRVTLPGAC
mgnify:CR=1 FL=1